MLNPTKLRIGILGAARIAPYAVIKPATAEPTVEVVAVASRDLARARRFAARHGIGTAYGSYAQLLEDPGVDAVYIALPNGLHGRWTAAALGADKHVLCEKPFAANAEEAVALADAARGTGLVVMEAFHYRYHGLTERMITIVGSGELGSIEHLEAWLCIPVLPAGDIRWSYGLAGGALMDVGCYAVHLLRTLSGAEPEVVSAQCWTRRPGVDRLARLSLLFPGGTTAAVTVSLWSRRLLAAGARVVGSQASMRVLNPYAPQLGHRLTVGSGSGTRRAVRVPRTPTSYAAQLRAFADAVLRGGPVLTDADGAVANMRVIDACYDAAGLPRRQPTR